MQVCEVVLRFLSTEKPEDQEAEKVEMYSSVSSGLSLAELGLLPAKKETHTVPATTKQAETQQTTTPQPQKEEKPPVIGDDVSSEPVVGPYVPADFGTISLFNFCQFSGFSFTYI